MRIFHPQNKTLYFIGIFLSLLCLAGSTFLFLYDRSLDENRLLAQAQETLQEDLNRCMAKYDPSLPYDPSGSEHCIACELTYSEAGRLISWTQSEYLPPKENIERLSKIEADEEFLETPGRFYVQMLTEESNRKKVILIPIYIQYQVKNNFLVPYVFLGRYSNMFTYEDRKNVKPFDKVRSSNFVRLASPKDGGYLITYKGLPVNRLRTNTRRLTLGLFTLGLIGFLLMIRLYSVRFGKGKYKDYKFFGLVLGIRILLGALGIPGHDYVDLELFSPGVAAMHEIFAPSLGDMSLNIFIFLLMTWLVYKNSFRLANPFYRKLVKMGPMSYVFAALTLVVSCLLIRLHFDLFRQVINSSQVPIEFTNIFQTNIFSFLVLLDIGLLLLAFGYLMILLLRYNILLGKKLNYSWKFLAFNLAILFGVNGILFLPSFSPFLATSGAIMVGMTMIYRMPDERIYKYDLPNLLILLTVAAVLSAHIVLIGIDSRNANKVDNIADRVLEDRGNKAELGYGISSNTFTNNPVELEAIQSKYREFNRDIGQFIDWFRLEYLDKNFEVFETQIFAYDQHGNRLDRNIQQKPQMDLDLSKGTRDLELVGVTLIDDKLYQIPSQNERFIDNYMAKFKLQLDTLDITMFLQLSSNPYAMGTISPILLVNTTTYEEEEASSSYDYGIYIDQKLSATNGDDAFPLNLKDNLNRKDAFFNYENPIYIEYIKSKELLGKGGGRTAGQLRTIIVRYPRQNVTEIFTTFSFVFYFYGLIALMFLVIPGLISRLFQIGFSISSVPIRSKIRVALVLVSILPIVGIIVFLYPYIDTRFNNQADTEIVEETKRVAKLLRDEMLQQVYPLKKDEAIERIKIRLNSLANTLPYDINVYNKDGRLISSTEPTLYKSQIRSGLMNSRAFLHLRYGKFSNLVLEERIGNLDFLAGYQPVVGDMQQPIGYVNVPFLNKKEELNEEVFGLLAYLANIYLFAFLLVGVIAVVVSNAITKPLQLIQTRLATISLGNVNKPINYKSEDEIGAIVNAYNNMVDKLAVSETKLKATQRQLAWRQMARQVAHEIKNPLTPMRLGIQHLNRAWATKSDKLERMFPKVMNTLMTQIDSLVTIANSFSQFAKMPDPVKKKISLNEIMSEVVNLYSATEGVDFKAFVSKEPFMILADRDQLSRALGNIVKNAIQALDDDEQGKIRVKMAHDQNTAYIEISDNGRGMTDEVRKRVFEPNFSTKSSGMGLGLAIVKRIIETTGGSISFETREGVGTTFYISLPSIEASDVADYEKVYGPR